MTSSTEQERQERQKHTSDVASGREREEVGLLRWGAEQQESRTVPEQWRTGPFSADLIKDIGHTLRRFSCFVSSFSSTSPPPPLLPSSPPSSVHPLSVQLQAAPPGMLLKPKYDRFRNESVTSSDDLMQSLAMSGKVVATPVVSSSTPSLPLPPLPPLDPVSRSSSSAGAAALAESPCLDGEQDATTTFCMLIPKMPQWKFSNSLLSRSPSNSSSSSNSSKDSGKASAPPAPSQASASSSSPSTRPGGAPPASGPVASLAAVLNSCDPVCVTPCSLQAIRGQRSVAAASAAGPGGGHGFRAAEVTGSPCGSGCTRSGMNRRVRVEGMWLGGEDLNQKGSFIHKPTQGWLHPDKKIVGQGASYIVRVSQTALFLVHQNTQFFSPSNHRNTD